MNTTSYRYFTLLTRTLVSFVFILGLITSCSDSHHKGDIVYTPIGASDAVGIGATPLTNGYAYRIRDHIEATGRGVQLINVGIPDAQIGAFDDVETEIVNKLNPDLITIFAGPNDLIDNKSPSSFETTLQKLLTNLREHNEGATIVIATMPDISRTPRYRKNPDPDVTNARVQQYNQAIRRQANAFGIPVADLYSAGFDDTEISDDDFHPNSKGYEHIAQVFFAVIQPLLPTIRPTPTVEE